MEAPERIYCESDGIGNIVKVHNIKWPDDEAENIEYTRTDAFIKKACVKLKKLMYDNLIFQGRLHREEVIETFVGDFRKYMEGE